MIKNTFLKLFLIAYPVFALLIITMITLNSEITTVRTLFLIVMLIWIAVILYIIILLYFSED